MYEEFDKDIQRHEDAKRDLQKKSEIEMKRLVDRLNFNADAHLFIKLSPFEEACKTLKKLPLFGLVAGYAEDF